jgi:2-oxoglutarate dehydrogenase E1 component
MPNLDYSYIANAHPEFIDNLYQQFKENPNSVEADWKNFFEGFDFAADTNSMEGEGISPKEFQVLYLINAYRRKGHLEAETNPIRERKDRQARLSLDAFGLSDKDLNTEFHAGSMVGLGKTTLKKIIDHLRSAYCNTIGAEYMYILEPEIRNWIKEKLEKRNLNLPLKKKKRILEKLNETVVFEEFLHTKYIGQKRFSLEGGETTIPALDAIINKTSEHGAKEVVIGMAHRGRLNVLANTLGKTYEEIFNEFEGNGDPDSTMGSGDVKYHLGFTSQITTTEGKNVRLKLCANPSHLEAVNTVVTGYVRAKTDMYYDRMRGNIASVLIHGDAAFAGQGIAYETIQMAMLEGYHVGGTIHYIINNQIGFTTDFDDARSANYCTSVARTTNTPVLHVNGDDVESVIFCAELAAEFRQQFRRDIIIDMVCYRKHGHNEGDDPKFTQPNLYALISKHKNPREIYVEKLISQGDINNNLAQQMNKDFWQLLQDRLNLVKQKPLDYKLQPAELAWEALNKSTPEDFEISYDTGVPDKTLDKVVKHLISYPEGFTPLKKVDRMLQQRRKAFFEDDIVDWASGELLAYGSLLLEGSDVRISGQDVKRGTFSHRHAVLFDEQTNEQYNRLTDLNPDTKLRIYNSLLSEYGVLAFEYGYSIANPNSLTIWEAQFGDFTNGAQIVIDQFISASEDKWNQGSGIVMLLPHGYEGQGPEHSSAKLERFLQQCGNFNMIVTNITTPSNFYHALRRQMAFPFRKPMVNMSPKSLLRHPKCVSKMEDFTSGHFKEIIEEHITPAKAKKIKRILFCTGKISYELMGAKEEHKITDTTIVRLEQLYPLPYKQIDKIIEKYKDAELFWVQEEPANMGAWTYFLSCYRSAQITVISRKSSASPATGHAKIHQREQNEIINKALNIKS